ncbi:WD40 repeat-like protein [Wallemia mellicola]|uniref:WD40 repeat-like protein n=1 Tax=Wallemia mellicola TaxID=1708541 RepID=A0A4T0NKF7_9BASI|nr:WD40 repeat-like protein [Wallemia mellicola]
MAKRISENSNQLISKRVKSSDLEDKLGLNSPNTQQLALSEKKDSDNQLIRSVQRTSKLAAPIIKLEGCHTDEITAVKFDLTGNFLVAVSTDRSISLWKTYTNENFGYIPFAHKQAITSLALSRTSPSNPAIITASADNTIAVWDSFSGKLIRRLREHTDIVNAISLSKNPSHELLASAGDDNKICIWDYSESKHPLHVINWNAPVISIEWSDDESTIFIGGLDNEIHAYDLKTHSKLYSLRGHSDTVTFLRLSPTGQYLLSCSNDSTVRIWDVRPFTNDPSRIHRILHGTVSSFEGVYTQPAWTQDAARVAVGSADRTVTVWDVETGNILYKLPGHTGTVNAVDIHPSEPIIVSSGKDAKMYLGELMESL